VDGYSRVVRDPLTATMPDIAARISAVPNEHTSRKTQTAT